MRKLKKVVDRMFFLLGWYGRSDLEGMGRAVDTRKGAREISRLPPFPAAAYTRMKAQSANIPTNPTRAEMENTLSNCAIILTPC